MVEKSLWTQKVERDPQHSHWYVQRFKDMAAEGADLHGEARMIDAMLPVARGCWTHHRPPTPCKLLPHISGYRSPIRSRR